MHQNCFRPGLCPNPRWRSLRSYDPTADPLVGWKGMLGGDASPIPFPSTCSTSPSRRLRYLPSCVPLPLYKFLITGIHSMHPLSKYYGYASAAQWRPQINDGHTLASDGHSNNGHKKWASLTWFVAVVIPRLYRLLINKSMIIALTLHSAYIWKHWKTSHIQGGPKSKPVYCCNKQ